jgi:hypothetical protein
MSVCATCGAETADDRDFCGTCGAYLRWDEPDEDEVPTTALVEPPAATPDPPTAVLEVEPPATVETVEPTEAVRVTLSAPDDPGAELGPPSVRAEAGGSVRLTGTVFNQSGVVDSFHLRIAGLDPSWWTVAPSTVNLVPFGSSEGVPDQQVEVHIHPPRTFEAEARAWDIALVARSRARDSDAAMADGTLTIAPFTQIECRVLPQTIRDRRSGRLVVPVRNLGNAPADVTFEAEDDEGVMRFAFSPPALTLAPGAEDHSEVEVTAREPVRGAPVHRRLSVAAVSGAERAERPATFIQEPEVARSHRLAWRVGLTLLAALLLIVGALTHWDANGNQGLCTHGFSSCLSYDVYAQESGIRDSVSHTTIAPQGLIAAVTSLGILAALFAALALIGARRGGLTWVAGCLAILLALGMLISLDGPAIGVWLVLLGGIAAVAAGALARA